MKNYRLYCTNILWETTGAFIVMPLLTHGRFHEQPQRRRRNHPHGLECSSLVGGTSLSLERNLGNRKDHTALIIKYDNATLLNLRELRDIFFLNNCFQCYFLVPARVFIFWCSSFLDRNSFKIIKTNVQGKLKRWKMLLCSHYMNAKIKHLCLKFVH